MPALEIIAVVFSLAYLVLLIRRNIWCWPVGFIGSVLSIKVVYDAGMRVEPFLYIYYAIMAIYGYMHWQQEDSKNETYSLKELRLTSHLALVGLGFLGTYLFGWIFDNYSEGERTYLDAFTSSFSVIATVLQVRKVMSNFIYWIVINAASAYLYFSQELFIYAGEFVIFFILSVHGFYHWWNKK